MKKTTPLSLLFITMFFAFASKAQTYYGAGEDIYTYANQPVILYGSSATTYKWFPSKGLDSDTIAQPTVTADSTYIYILRYTVPSDTTHYYDTMVVYIVSPPSPSSAASCTNMVNNGDMESGPHSNAWGNLASAWYAPPGSAGTPDYYSTYASGSPCGIPGEFYGAPPTYSGVGFSGIIINGSGNPYLEYMEQALPCTLLSGQTYSVSFSAAWAGTCNYDCGNIGLLLSTSQVTGIPGNLFISGSPQVSGSCTNHTSWQTFSGTVTGAGEKYLTIGHFGAQSSCSAIASNGSNYNVTYNYIDNVVVNPIPPTVTASQTTICKGQALYLSETGSPGASCTWYDPTGTNIGTGASIGAYATVSGNYSVSVNVCSSCSGGVISSVYITVTPTVALSITGPSTVCSGSPNTYTANVSGAASYYWNPSGATTSTHAYTFFSPIISSGSFTVSSNNCGYGTFAYTVNPIPTLTVTATPTLICSGSSSTLTAVGNGTYTWSTGSTGASSVVTPTATSIYTVTGTNSLTCVNTKTVSVSVQTNTCTGTPPASYTISSSGTYNPTTGFIAQNMYIGNGTNTPSYTINSPAVTIAPSVSITVANGATLTVNAGWLHACGTCAGSMWQGIYVQPGGVLTINNSIIEDAIYAVYTTSCSGTCSSIPSYSITNSIFNNNATAIYIDANGGNLSTNSIYNTVFTCRSLGSHVIANIATTKSNIAAATPLNPSTSNPIDYTLAGPRSQFGIRIKNVNPSYAVAVGNKTQSNNLFDNLDYGIYAVQSSLTVKNNTFQNMTGNSYTTAIGVGIAVDETTGIESAVSATVIVGNSSTTIDNTERNYFTNCLYGINTKGLRVGYINNNIFNNETTASTFTTSGSTVCGQFGVHNNAFGLQASATVPQKLQYANNTCQNFATAHFIDFGIVYNTVSQSILYTGNTINAYTTTIAPNNYCNYGIYAQQSSTFGAASSSVPQDMFSITTNSITNVNTSCISINSVNTNTVTGFVTVNLNTELSVKYAGTYTVLQSPPIAAIGVYNSPSTKVSDNALVKCTGLTTYTTTNAQYIAGIYTKSSPHCTINCNKVTCVGEGFVFEGGSPNSTWRSNSTSTGRYGLVLRNNGYMSNQGAVGNSIRTVYGNASPAALVNAQTLCDNSNPTYSTTPAIMYVSNLGYSCPNTNTYNELPCVNSAISGGFAYSTTSPTPGLIVTGNNGTSPCASGGGGGGGGMAVGGGSMTNSMSSTNNTSDLQGLIAPGAALPSYNTETRWANQYYVNSNNPNIAAASGYENAKTFALADAAYAAGNYSQAQSLVNSVSASNIIETNWQQVNTILLKQAVTPTYALTNADIAILKNVARQCPTTGGTIVYRARAVINAYYQTIIEYPGDCQNTSIANRVASNTDNTESISLDDSQTASLYPNPNNGSMNIDYKIKDDARLEIMDITGKLVVSYNLPATGTTLQIKNNYLQNGMYLYRVISNDTLIKLGKFVVMQ